jgi:hypothetical protein
MTHHMLQDSMGPSDLRLSSERTRPPYIQMLQTVSSGVSAACAPTYWTVPEVDPGTIERWERGERAPNERSWAGWSVLSVPSTPS